MNNTSISRPRRAEQILKQEVEGTVVLLCMNSGKYYSLDKLGGRVWDFCAGNHTVAEMAVLLEKDYEATAATIESDLVDLLTDLAREKLVFDP